MLIRRPTLERIVAGEIDTAFRRQRRPTVKAGGTLRTAIGILDILEVEPVVEGEITVEDAMRAGFASVADLLAAMPAKEDARVYRVRLRPATGPDPRELLRADDALDDEALVDLRRRLDRLDAELVSLLAEGIASACRETALVRRELVDAWLSARRGASARIGHVDLFAVPR